MSLALISPIRLADEPVPWQPLIALGNARTSDTRGPPSLWCSWRPCNYWPCVEVARGCVCVCGITGRGAATASLIRLAYVVRASLSAATNCLVSAQISNPRRLTIPTQIGPLLDYSLCCWGFTRLYTLPPSLNSENFIPVSAANVEVVASLLQNTISLRYFALPSPGLRLQGPRMKCSEDSVGWVVGLLLNKFSSSRNAQCRRKEEMSV